MGWRGLVKTCVLRAVLAFRGLPPSLQHSKADLRLCSPNRPRPPASLPQPPPAPNRQDASAVMSDVELETAVREGRSVLQGGWRNVVSFWLGAVPGPPCERGPPGRLGTCPHPVHDPHSPPCRPTLHPPTLPRPQQRRARTAGWTRRTPGPRPAGAVGVCCLGGLPPLTHVLYDVFYHIILTTGRCVSPPVVRKLKLCSGLHMGFIRRVSAAPSNRVVLTSVL